MWFDTRRYTKLTAATASPVIDYGSIASASELAKVVDLSRLPQPENAKLGDSSAAELSGTVPIGVSAATDFYLAALAKLGFQPSTEPHAKTITADYAQVTLVKGGHTLSFSANQLEAGTTMIQLIRHGNVDAQTLPESAGAERSYGSSTLLWFVGKGSVAEEAAFVRSALAKQGWQEFGPPHAARVVDPEQQQMSFRNQGYLLSASVGKAPAQNNRTMVQYQLRTLAHELPAPADAVDVEYGGDRHILKCKIPGELEIADKFYRQAMPAAGYKALEHDEPKPKRRLQRYETADHGIYLVSLTNDDDKQTVVDFLYYSPELLAKMRETEGKPAESPADETPDEPTSERKSIFARLLPLPEKVADLKFNAQDESIEFGSSESIAALVKSLQQSLTAAGWQELPGTTIAEANADAVPSAVESWDVDSASRS